ncbi:hypothetical protein MBEHAL_0253 [Halarchaeum acidiphilum MH1-52-1]|uniref:Uncharacterized protein n=1 Tax=Halarchaeum acidiphilum MH1-52-1 TaxID=1261545 RepID=U3A9Q5_9EURY|nr:hypothetical protein MBEHAL_0253 [Halarchaeum acidiphilum MH1-52-1]
MRRRSNPIRRRGRRSRNRMARPIVADDALCASSGPSQENGPGGN